MRTLLLGAAGQLGQALHHEFADHELIEPRHTDLDISQPAAIDMIQALKPQLVLLTAAWTNVDGCALDPERAFRENTLGPKYVALACRALGVPLVYISTNEVFDGQATQPYHEYDQPRPINVYGRSKWGGEQAVLHHAPGAIIVRVAWLFGGPHNFVRTMLRLGAERERDGGTLRVVADEVGSPTYAPHAAHALRKLVDAGIPGIYHVVNEGACSRYELACAALEAANMRVPVDAITLADFDRPSTPPPYTPLANTAARSLGIELPHWRAAVRSFVTGLEREQGA